MATAKELMERAKQLMAQAKQVEEANALKIGKFVMANIESLTIADLKKHVAEVTGEAIVEKTDGKKKKGAQEPEPGAGATEKGDKGGLN